MKYLSKLSIVIAFTFIAAVTFAAEPILETGAPVGTTPGETRALPEERNIFLAAHFSYLDLLLPGKLGLSGGLFRDETQSFELEYTRGSLSVPGFFEDLASIKDERVSIIGKTYFGGRPFYLSYGLAYYSVKARLGSKYLSSSSNVPEVNLLEYQMLGGTVGVGHQWIWDNGFLLAVDWFAWSQPLVTLKQQNKFIHRTSDPNDREDASELEDLFKYLPRLTALKLHLGYTF